MPTRESLASDAAGLGIEAGDTIFVHSSLKSIGPVNGGASSVVGALEDVLGHEGLLLMPSFNLLPKGGEARAQNWDRNTTPSSAGWITEFFRTMPGTVRHDHALTRLDGNEIFVVWDQLHRQKLGNIVVVIA